MHLHDLDYLKHFSHLLRFGLPLLRREIQSKSNSFVVFVFVHAQNREGKVSQIACGKKGNGCSCFVVRNVSPIVGICTLPDCFD